MKNKTNLIILCLFAVLTFIAGINHEPWADEAQAWLIARDCTISDMIFNVLKYDGHPVLWYLLLKTLIFCSFPYKALFTVPWLCSCFGIFLFLFKSKFPLIIKILFPFTFFIFYQYCVLARNHSLVFPILALIAVNYKNRMQRSYLYSFLLIILASISAYSFIIAIVLLFFFIAETIKIKQIKNIIPFSITSLYLFLTVLYLRMPADCTWGIEKYPPPITNIIFNLLHTVNKTYFFNTAEYTISIFSIILITILYIGIYKIFCRTKYQTLFFILINFSVITVITMLYCQFWHQGYIMITLFFSCWILADENNITSISFKENKIFYAILIFIFILQIHSSIKIAVYDIGNNYSGSLAAAEFIKKNNYDKEEIISFGYHTVALQPYFKNNIYSNFNKSYWEANKKSHLEIIRKCNKLSTILVYSTLWGSSYINVNTDEIKQNYEQYNFKGKVYKGSSFEPADFIIFVKKNK